MLLLLLLLLLLLFPNLFLRERKYKSFLYSALNKHPLYNTCPHNKEEKVEFAEKSRGEGVLPYMGHIGMCRCEGYGFQAVYSSIGYINQNVWV